MIDDVPLQNYSITLTKEDQPIRRLITSLIKLLIWDQLLALGRLFLFELNLIHYRTTRQYSPTTDTEGPRVLLKKINVPNFGEKIILLIHSIK